MIIGAISLLIYLGIKKNNAPINLPKYLRWFDNADLYVGRDVSTYLKVIFSGWWSRYTWLAFRNPTNYFNYVYLGFVFKESFVYIKHNSEEDKIGDTSKEGFRHIELVNGDGKRYYEYYYIKKYWFNPKVCFRFRMGWKIKDNKNKEKDAVQYCLVIAPYKEYTGV